MRVVLMDGEGIWVKGSITFVRESINSVRVVFQDKRGVQHNVSLDMILEIVGD
jgi:hypothetical protein